MVKSNATTVEQYLAELPDERRSDVVRVRDMVLANLPEGYVETMRWGMITYEVPLDTYPDTYNAQPLIDEVHQRAMESEEQIRVIP